MFKDNFKNLCRKKGISPTKACNAVGISSAAYAQWTNDSVPRNATLKKIAEYFDVPIETLLKGNEDTIKFKTDNIQSITPVSVVEFEELGTVTAGYNGLAEEVYTGKTIDVPVYMLKGHKKEEFFVLQVKGDSMYPMFLDGDNVLVRRCDYVESGSIAVVCYNGYEATVKKVYYGDGWIDLVPLNNGFPSKRIEGNEMEQVFIRGKVIASIRNFD